MGSTTPERWTVIRDARADIRRGLIADGVPPEIADAVCDKACRAAQAALDTAPAALEDFDKNDVAALDVAAQILGTVAQMAMESYREAALGTPTPTSK